jgi:hypothetical protein
MPFEAARIGIPERFEIVDEGGVLRIQWQRPRLVGVVALIFAVGWDAFLVSWYFDALSRDRLDMAMLLFPILHVVAGLALPYVALVFLLNAVVVEVGNQTVTVRHRPMPFPGNRTITAAEVRQLFSVERRGRKGAVSHDLMAQLASGREARLVTGLSTDREARFIEQRIESRLGLADRPVAGELPR